MTKDQVKEEVRKTLRKVEPEQLPAFKKVLEVRTFFELCIGQITKETSDAIMETLDEFSEVAE